ncbi:MAG: hypothetical protein V4515_04590 [Chloroflexota bacterium]
MTPMASGVHFKLNSAEAITFVIYEVSGSTVIGMKESIAGASEQNLLLSRRITSNGVGTAQLWTERTQTASATITKNDTTAENCTLVTVTAPQLSAGFDCVECTVDGAALCIAIIHDLSVDRSPALLAAPAV